MTETAALLSVLRERDIKLWVEHDQLKCSAPAGALDAEMRAALASRKDELLTLLGQSQSNSGATMSVNREEDASPTLLPTVSRQVPMPVILDRHERMADFIQALRGCGYDLASCAARLGVFPRLGVNFWKKMRSNWIARPSDPIDNLITLFIDGLPVGTSGDLVSSAFVVPRPEAAGRRLQAGDGFSEATEART